MQQRHYNLPQLFGRMIGQTEALHRLVVPAGNLRQYSSFRYDAVESCLSPIHPVVVVQKVVTVA